jgi:hypothetical protein
MLPMEDDTSAKFQRVQLSSGSGIRSVKKMVKHCGSKIVDIMKNDPIKRSFPTLTSRR